MSQVNLVEILQIAIGPISAIAGVIVTNLFNERRYSSERKERLLSYINKLRVNALVETYSAIARSYRVVNLYGNSPSKLMGNIDEFSSKVGNVIDDFEEIWQKHAVWLEPINAPIETLRGSFLEAKMAIHDAVMHRNPTANIDWEKVPRTFKEAKKAIRQELKLHLLESELVNL